MIITIGNVSLWQREVILDLTDDRYQINRLFLNNTAVCNIIRYFCVFSFYLSKTGVLFESVYSLCHILCCTNHGLLCHVYHGTLVFSVGVPSVPSEGPPVTWLRIWLIIHHSFSLPFTLKYFKQSSPIGNIVCRDLKVPVCVGSK